MFLEAKSFVMSKAGSFMFVILEQKIVLNHIKTYTYISLGTQIIIRLMMIECRSKYKYRFQCLFYFSKRSLNQFITIKLPGLFITMKLSGLYVIIPFILLCAVKHLNHEAVRVIYYYFLYSIVFCQVFHFEISSLYSHFSLAIICFIILQEYFFLNSKC